MLDTGDFVGQETRTPISCSQSRRASPTLRPQLFGRGRSNDEPDAVVRSRSNWARMDEAMNPRHSRVIVTGTDLNVAFFDCGSSIRVTRTLASGQYMAAERALRSTIATLTSMTPAWLDTRTRSLRLTLVRLLRADRDHVASRVSSVEASVAYDGVERLRIEESLIASCPSASCSAGVPSEYAPIRGVELWAHAEHGHRPEIDQHQRRETCAVACLGDASSAAARS